MLVRFTIFLLMTVALGFSACGGSPGAEVKRLASGLSYRSEIDAPVEYVFLEGTPGKELLSVDEIGSLAGNAQTSYIEIKPADEFFRQVTNEADWLPADEKDAAARYRQLEEILGGRFTDCRFYKIGKRDLTLLVLCRDEKGSFVGFRTRAVET